MSQVKKRRRYERLHHEQNDRFKKHNPAVGAGLCAIVVVHSIR